MKFPVLWSGLGCCSVKMLGDTGSYRAIKNPRVNKVTYPILSYYTSGIMLSRTDLGMFFRRFLLASTLKSRFAFVVLLNTILREPSLSVTMTMATFSFHMSNLIGTLVRVQLDDGLKLFWEQVEWHSKV